MVGYTGSEENLADVLERGKTLRSLYTYERMFS